MSSNRIFCLIKSLKPNDVQFTIMIDQENQQMLTVEKVKPFLFGIFALKKHD